MGDKVMCKDSVRYRAKEDFVHRKVAGNDVLISIGANVANFNGYITLNPTASFLWDALQQPQTADTLTGLLTEEFEVSEELARNDVNLFLDMLLRNKMIVNDEE